MKPLPGSNRPEFIQSYLDQTRKTRSWRYPFDQVRMVAVDVEASGFDQEKDRLLSVAVVELSGYQIQMDQCREWLVYQPGITANKATEIHGILPSETLQGIPEKQVLEELVPVLSGAIVVGHNIWFDMLMINEALWRNFRIRLRNATIDVALMSMNELPPFRKSGYINQHPPTMEDLCAHLGLPVHDRHTATGDAYIAAQIFLLLCGQIRQRTGRLTKWNLPIKKP